MTHRIAPTFSLARFSASFLLKLILVFGVQNAWSQCPTVEAIMVDACGSESLNEFIIINSGGGFNTADIELSYDLNNNILSPQNNDINIDIDNLASDPTPCNLQVGNPGVLSGCSNVIPVGPGIAIPPNSIVVLQTSAGANNLYDFSALCGMGECVYVISSACARTAGGFTNSGSGTRETIFQIAGGCQQFIVYDRASLVGGNGAYYLPVSGAYGNDGCVVPPTSPAPLPPDVDPLPNVMECGSYTLPAITGTNLSGNEGYFTGPNRTGTQLFPGDMITTTTTIYINDFSAQGCEDEEMFTVTISPAPVVNPVADQTVCQGTPVSVVFSGTPGASFNWTNDNTAIGLGGSGTGNISFNSSTSGSQEIATITVTPSIGMCVGTPETFMITVNPNPTVNNPGNQSVCGGDQVDIFFSGSGSATYNWTNNNPAIGLGGSGSGDISFTANNVVNQTTGQITVTPSENGCVGTPQTFQIIVNPAPFVNAVADITDCPGAPIVVNFSGTFGATFNWTNDNPAIGLAPAGSGGISFIADNTGIQQMATITVTPSLNGCVGTPITFTITIEPNPTLFNPGDQTYCSGDQVNLFLTGNDATGFVWTNSNTAIGLAGAGAGDIVFTAANVSMLTQGTITVTPQSALCTGMDEQFVITITPAPEADPIADITTCGGQPISQAITGTSGVQFNWTNSNPAIGLPASGTGDIDFISAQVANSETGIITITPVNGNCMGVTTSFSITVDPGPTSDPVADLTICAGDTVDIQILGSSGAAFNWINDNTNSGLAASGSDTIFFIGTASGMSEISTVIINPEENGCLGPADTVIIQVNPIPQFDNPGNSSVCSGQNALIPISGTPSGAAFDWTNNNLGIGLPGSGSGDLNFLADTSSNSATIVVTPNFGGCVGPVDSFILYAVQSPEVIIPGDLVACSGTQVTVDFVGTFGATYVWTNSDPAIGLAASGSGDIDFMAANVAGQTIGEIVVHAELSGCQGPNDTFSIIVNPLPDALIGGDEVICAGDTATLIGSGGFYYLWNTGDTTQNLLVAPTFSTFYALTVTNNFGCSDVDNAFLAVTQISIDTLLSGSCNPVDTGTFVSVFTSFSGCDSTIVEIVSLLPTDTSYVFDFTCNPSDVGVVQTTLSNEFGCDSLIILDIQFDSTLIDTTYLSNGTCDPAMVGVSEVLLSSSAGCDSLLIINTTLLPSDTIFVLAATCDTSLNGTTTIETFPSTTVCDSVVITDFYFEPDLLDTTYLSAATCDPAMVGTSQQLFSNFLGCDSLVITTTALTPNDTTLLSSTTCDPNATGTFTAIFPSSTLCDSIVIETVIFDPALLDTTYLSAATCDPAMVGTSQQLFSNILGCDSLVITTTALTPNDTTLLSSTTCDPSATGTFTAFFPSSTLCDSIVIETVTFDPALLDTTYLSAATCDPAMVGTSQQLFSNILGCDSLVITITALTPNDTTLLSSTTCDPNATGTFTAIFPSSTLCDSVVIETVTFDPALLDTTYLSAATCDPAMVGTSQQLFSNFLGCDSLVITTTALTPNDTTLLSSTTCDPNATGTFTAIFPSSTLCDSIVIETVTFDPALLDTTYLSAATCDPAMVGTSQQLFSNFLGCDSLVITTTALTPNDTTLLNSTTCDPNATGTFTAIFPSSTLCDSIVIETVTFDPALCVLDAAVESNSVLCNGSADGALILLVQNGGMPPYSYSWMESSGNTGNGTINTIGTPDTIFNLPAGTYSITITDNSGFIQTTLNLNIDEPSPLNLQTTIDSDYNGFDVSCDGLPDGIASAVATGGTNPISYLWENGTSTGQASGLSAGNYTVTATDANGCSITAGVSLSAPPALNLQLVTGSVQCGDTATTVSYLAQGGIEPYEFYIDGAPQAGTTSLLAEGSYILQLADANGCSLDSVFALDLPDPPQLFLPTDTVVALGSTLTLEALTNVLVWDSLYWSPPADSSCVACLTQVWQPQTSQAYTLTLIDTLGCIVSARILVGVEKTIPLYIPNVFKPDDDGVNDFFTIGAGPSIVELETLSIFDRWGNQVYQLLAPTPVEDWMGWDGTYRGEKMNPGVYIYLLRVRLIDGTTVDKAGDLLLSR